MINKTKESIELDRITEVILNSLPSGIIFCGPDGNILFINRTYADYLGVSQSEVIGKNITEYIPGSRIIHVLETGEPELGFKCSVGEGKEKKILIVNRIPVLGEDGTVVGVISQSLFGDIGELKDLSTRLDVLEKKVSSYREKIRSVLSAKHSTESIKGNGPAITKAKKLLAKYAKTNSPVLLAGPTGSGKELFAHSLHSESQRANGSFVSINCAAIPHDLLESELFGYAPGAFTGAQKQGKLGKIELADKGTLFLDEIGDMSLDAQVKLLRVLEDKLVFRLGAIKPAEVSFRLIVATNRDLKSMIREGKFREELYYRLNTMIINIPPLVERKEDIPVLARHILDALDRQDVSCSSEVMDTLMRYEWPGNVRELKNALECALSLMDGDANTLYITDLPAEIVSSPSTIPFDSSYVCRPQPLTLADSEHKLIQASLRENDWNMAKTAKLLGISRASLYEKAKKYNLSRPKIL